MEDEVIYARDIDDCSVCPLYEKDCPGGWTSSGSGTPIEPPCTSWNGDEEIYEGMYDRYKDWKLEDIKQRTAELIRREQEEREKQQKNRKEYLERRIAEYSNYDNAKTRYAGECLDKWYCPRCHNWFYPNGCASPYRDRDGIETSICPICNTRLAHGYELD